MCEPVHVALPSQSSRPPIWYTKHLAKFESNSHRFEHVTCQKCFYRFPRALLSYLGFFFFIGNKTQPLGRINNRQRGHVYCCNQCDLIGCFIFVSIDSTMLLGFLRIFYCHLQELDHRSLRIPAGFWSLAG